MCWVFSWLCRSLINSHDGSKGHRYYLTYRKSPRFTNDNDCFEAQSQAVHLISMIFSAYSLQKSCWNFKDFEEKCFLLELVYSHCPLNPNSLKTILNPIPYLHNSLPSFKKSLPSPKFHFTHLPLALQPLPSTPVSSEYIPSKHWDSHSFAHWFTPPN